MLGCSWQLKMCSTFSGVVEYTCFRAQPGTSSRRLADDLSLFVGSRCTSRGFMWPEAASFGASETEEFENEFWHTCTSYFKFPSNHHPFAHPVDLKISSYPFLVKCWTWLSSSSPQYGDIRFLLLLATMCHGHRVCIFTFLLWEFFDRTLL